MEFLNDIFVVVSGHKLGFSDLSLQYVWVFYPHFSVLQNAIHEQTQVNCFANYFVRIFEPREEYVFL